MKKLLSLAIKTARQRASTSASAARVQRPPGPRAVADGGKASNRCRSKSGHGGRYLAEAGKGAKKPAETGRDQTSCCHPERSEKSFPTPRYGTKSRSLAALRMTGTFHRQVFSRPQHARPMPASALRRSSPRCCGVAQLLDRIAHVAQGGVRPTPSLTPRPAPPWRPASRQLMSVLTSSCGNGNTFPAPASAGAGSNDRQMELPHIGDCPGPTHSFRNAMVRASASTSDRLFQHPAPRARSDRAGCGSIRPKILIQCFQRMGDGRLQAFGEHVEFGSVTTVASSGSIAAQCRARSFQRNSIEPRLAITLRGSFLPCARGSCQDAA